MSRVHVVFSLLCAACCCTSTLAFVLEDCGSQLGRINEMSFSSCDLSDERCGVERGVEATASIKFTPSKDISRIEARAFGIMLDTPIPLPLEKPNVCRDRNSGVKCPLKRGEESEYKFALYLDKMIPPMIIDIMWQFVTEKNEKIICVKFPARIK